mmetsp:Transcript_27943/g.88954  ORF Transcript_27943/g.88954 Transcript_27943/m.88954 type:complete len:291 (-) Transcript_27943:1779-2651(-)
MGTAPLNPQLARVSTVSRSGRGMYSRNSRAAPYQAATAGSREESRSTSAGDRMSRAVQVYWQSSATWREQDGPPDRPMTTTWPTEVHARSSAGRVSMSKLIRSPAGGTSCRLRRRDAAGRCGTRVGGGALAMTASCTQVCSNRKVSCACAANASPAPAQRRSMLGPSFLSSFSSDTSTNKTPLQPRTAKPAGRRRAAADGRDPDPSAELRHRGGAPVPIGPANRAQLPLPGEAPFAQDHPPGARGAAGRVSGVDGGAENGACAAGRGPGQAEPVGARLGGGRRRGPPACP